MSEGFKFYSGLKGSNVVMVGNEPSVYQYLKSELQTAINDCPDGGVVILEPGTYTLTSFLQVYKPITIMCEEPEGAIITSALATQTVKVNVPASSNLTAIQINFKNIYFDNTNAGAAPGCRVDNNGGCSLPLTVNFDNCYFFHTGALGLDIAHTTVALGTELEYINLSDCVVGTTTLAHPLAGDQFNCFNCLLESTITMSAEATSSIYNLIDCIYLNATPTVGGNAAQLANVWGPIYDASPFGGAMTKGASGDFTDLGMVAAGPGFTCLGLYS